MGITHELAQALVTLFVTFTMDKCITGYVNCIFSSIQYLMDQVLKYILCTCKSKGGEQNEIIQMWIWMLSCMSSHGLGQNKSNIRYPQKLNLVDSTTCDSLHSLGLINHDGWLYWIYWSPGTHTVLSFNFHELARGLTQSVGLATGMMPSSNMLLKFSFIKGCMVTGASPWA